MTRQEFKDRWESNENGGGITFDDVAECHEAWGLGARPKTMRMSAVLARVLVAAGVPPRKTRKASDGLHILL